jgi:hypothetical protein
MKTSIKIKIDLNDPDYGSVSKAITFLESLLPQPVKEQDNNEEPAKKEKAPEAPSNRKIKNNEPKAKATPKSEGPSIDGVREALALKVENHRDSIRAKLTELGAKNVTTLDPDKYVEFLDYLQNLG